ncbi:MAG: two-component regulator propeller domain-containing protein, partial [Bacteroidota bacterium]
MLRSIVLFLFTVAWGVSAQPHAGAPSVPTADRFTHLGVADGLSQSTVTTILQDRDGFLWFGTDDGLNRYDGVSFTVYRHANEDTTSLASSRVLHLLEDRRGVLWVATQGGLQWLDRSTGTFHMPPGGPGTPRGSCGTIVRALLEGPDGALWTGALTGQVCRRTSAENAFEPIQRGGGPTNRSTQSLFVASDQSIWISGSPRACRVRSGEHTCQPVPGAPAQSQPIFVGPRLGMIGTADIGSAVASRLTRWEAGAWRPLETVRGTRMSVGPQSAARIGDHLWIGTESSGVVVLDVATGATARLRPEASLGSGFVDPTVHVVYRDREGAVWLGTSDGVSRWDGRAERFALYRSRLGDLSSDRINGLHIAGDGTVWVGTNDGLNRLRPEAGTVSVYRRPASGTSAHPNAFWRVYEDARGRIVVGSRREGIFVVDTVSGAFRRDAALDALLAPLVNRTERAAIRFIGEDRRGRTWVGIADGAAVRGLDGRIRVYPSRTARLPAHRVNVVYEDQGGTVWLGTDAGLCRLSEAEDRFRCLTARDGLSAEVIWTVAESAQTPGVVWAGTIGGGLCRVGRADLAVDCPDAALPSNVIYGILPDASGALWLTTTSGLVRYDPATGTVRRYTEADGLQSDEFDLMAFAQGPGGWMVVGGRKGLNRFHPERLRQRTSVPPVHITAVRVLGDPRPGLPASGDTLRLRHDESVFAVDFAALDYTDPRNNRYRYRLRGFDDDWRETDGRRPTATYTRVPPGAYTFEVVGSNHDGVFAPEPARLGVEVRPAWWQRSDLRLGAGLLVGGGLVLGVAGGVRRRVRRAEAERAEQVGLQRRLAESRERERYRIARDLHDGPVQGLYRL